MGFPREVGEPERWELSGVSGGGWPLSKGWKSGRNGNVSNPEAVLANAVGVGVLDGLVRGSFGRGADGALAASDYLNSEAGELLFQWRRG